MRDFDPDAFAERAAICEFDAGMTRFRAETAAAAEQSISRWEALRHEADSIRNPARDGDYGSNADRQSADDLSAVQPGAEEENRPMPVGHIHAGRGGLELLPLRGQRGASV